MTSSRSPFLSCFCSDNGRWSSPTFILVSHSRFRFPIGHPTYRFGINRGESGTPFDLLAVRRVGLRLPKYSCTNRMGLNKCRGARKPGCALWLADALFVLDGCRFFFCGGRFRQVLTRHTNWTADFRACSVLVVLFRALKNLTFPRVLPEENQGRNNKANERQSPKTKTRVWSCRSCGPWPLLSDSSSGTWASLSLLVSARQDRSGYPVRRFKIRSNPIH